MELCLLNLPFIDYEPEQIVLGRSEFAPQNVPLWDIDYFRPVNFKEEQIWEL